MSRRKLNKLPDNIARIGSDGKPVLKESSKKKEPCMIIESLPMPKDIQDQIDAAFKEAAAERSNESE